MRYGLVMAAALAVTLCAGCASETHNDDGSRTLSGGALSDLEIRANSACGAQTHPAYTKVDGPTLDATVTFTCK